MCDFVTVTMVPRKSHTANVIEQVHNLKNKLLQFFRFKVLTLNKWKRQNIVLCTTEPQAGYKVTMLLVAIYRSVVVKKLTVMTYAVYFGTKYY